jgi:hypothetical protein
MMLRLSPGPSGWAIDFGRWAWGLGAGALSGAAGALILTPALVSIDPDAYLLHPDSHVYKMAAYIFAYGAIKNMLTYMATNQIPSPFKDVHSTTIDPTKAGGVKMVEEKYQEQLPVPLSPEKKDK